MRNLLKVFMTAIVLICFISTVDAAVTLRYYNKDSKKHTMDVKISGSSKEVTFESSRTASVTIQGSATSAKIETSCGTIEVKDGDSIEIKDGCITVK